PEPVGERGAERVRGLPEGLRRRAATDLGRGNHDRHRQHRRIGDRFLRRHHLQERPVEKVVSAEKAIATLSAGVVYSATYGAPMDEEKGFTIRDRRGAGSEAAEKTGESAAMTTADRRAVVATNHAV